MTPTPLSVMREALERIAERMCSVRSGCAGIRLVPCRTCVARHALTEADRLAAATTGEGRAAEANGDLDPELKARVRKWRRGAVERERKDRP